MTNDRLHNKVAIITGAGRSIGKAIALAFAQAGAAVACAARTTGEIEQTVQEIEQAGGRGLALPTDVTDMAAVERMCAGTAETFGGIDILVINAGVSLDRGAVEESAPDAWRATLEVNLFGAYNCARAAIPHLKARGGGKIITVGSGMGRQGRPGSSAYSCSKAALWMLTRVLAQELWPYNISVNELIPGPVDTSMTVDPAARQGPAFTTESEWVKRPEDVVPLALFLATQPTIGPTAQSFSLMRRDG
jgi:3-oxoacyl-[acyl-carrier protein] reductase